jgi:hypothetical protein
MPQEIGIVKQAASRIFADHRAITLSCNDNFFICEKAATRRRRRVRRDTRDDSQT